MDTHGQTQTGVGTAQRISRKQSIEDALACRGEGSGFDAFMRSVDVAVERIAGCSVYDLDDYCCRDAYDDGEKPATVARRALRNAGF